MEESRIELDQNDPSVRIQQQLYRNVMDIAHTEGAVTVEKKIEEAEGVKRVVFVIRAAHEDVGRILGKGGKMILGIRRLAYSTAAKLGIGMIEVEVAEA